MGYRVNLKNIFTKAYKAKINQYQSLLLPGRYFWNASLSGLYCKEEIHKEAFTIINHTSDELNCKFKLFRKLICKIINIFFYIDIPNDTHIDNTNKLFSASLILFSTVNKEFKFFDFENDYVVTIYGEKKSQKIINSVSKLDRYFFTTIDLNSPFWDNNRNGIIEYFICGEKFATKDCINIYFDNLKKYLYDNIKNIKISGTKTNLLSTSERIIQCFNLTINDLEYPIIFLHGDLWKSNIIKNEEKFYLIDFEKAGEFYFLYDFFSLIFYEYSCNRNFCCIETYFDGGYDKLITEVSTLIGYPYLIEKRNVYFSIFVYESYIKKWKKENYIPVGCLTQIYNKFYKLSGRYDL